MPRPGEDRSDVGGTAQFNNIGPVPLPASASRFRFPLPLPASASRFRFPLPLPASASASRFRFPLPLPASRFPLPASRFPLPASPASRFQYRTCPASRFRKKLPLVRLVPRPDLVLPELGGVVGGCPPDRPPRRREVRPHRFVDELEQSHPPLGDEVGAAGGVAFRIALLAKGVTVGIRNLNFCECILGRSPLPLPTSPKLFGRS